MNYNPNDVPKFEFSGNEINISGKSIPEDADSVWRVFLRQLTPYIDKLNEVTINFKLDIFNTASSLYLTNIFEIISLYNTRCKININWYFFEEDEDMQFLGETYQERNPKLHIKLLKRHD